MSAKHNTFVKYGLFFFFALIIGCGGGKKIEDNDITMYVSLGPTSTYPENSAGFQDRLFYYWGRTVRFSVQGLDEGVNDEINTLGTSVFDWTGFGYEDGTLYASYVFELTDSKGEYPGGRYKFKAYVDWNDNGIFDNDDVYFVNYKVFANQDKDDSTEETSVAQEDWGSYIQYDDYDNSLVVDDPLDVDAGTPWAVSSIGEGDMAVF